MRILKYLVKLSLYIAPLLVLLHTSNYYFGFTIIFIVTSIYVIKQVRLHKAKDLELLNRVQLVEAMFNLSTDLILYKDLDNKIVACNAELLKFFNLNKEELVGNILTDVLEKSIEKSCRSVAVLENFRANTEIAIKTVSAIKFVDQFDFIDQGSSYFSVMISPVCDKRNKITGTIVVARDVTVEHKAAKLTKEKEEQLKCILGNMPICAFMKDRNGNFVIGSSVFERLIDCKNSEMSNVVLSEIYPKEHLEDVYKEDYEVYKTKKPLVTIREVLFPNQNFLGRVYKTPVFDDQGNVDYLVVMYENIEVENEIKRQKEYFIETLIHDLKIPTLAQLRGLELVRNETLGSINIDQKEMITQIEGSCRYILDMISMVLKTYRFENGQKKFHFEEFKVTNLLDECISDIEPTAKEKGINVLYNLKDKDLVIEADRADIRTVVLNLLSNAIMYSNKGGNVYINMNVEAGMLNTEIVSNGITLSDREYKMMFTKNTAELPKYTTIGHGIGLYLCKKIIESHNGEICASSDGKSFNKFLFQLPLIHKNDSFQKIVSKAFI